MVIKTVRSLLCGLVTLALAQDLVAQASYPVNTPDRAPSSIGTAHGVITSIVTQGDSVVARRTIDLNEEVQVIVQFVSPPLSSVHRTQGLNAPAGMSMSAVQSQIEGHHTQFRSDLVRLETGSADSTTAARILKSPGSRISAEYRTVFNGVALRSRRWLVERLRALLYVRSITPDNRVHALDSTSNHQIGADSVWAQYGLTGAGVKVGILDTGIDYMHPDLGGGIGPGYKVAGGWSFVEYEPDVMDGYGHGTHVAGIIAANGPTLQGVAPDATLYAIKVLTSDGWGFSSWIMAGLERAVDPDGITATDDHLDIVNLSIGGTGDPTDPLSQAIDNATASGVLCVVAAGNDGPSGQTIGSPGCASSALTVGACDSVSNIAYFSSRGPTSYSFTIKPDIIAPGVSITSTFPGGTHQTMSGTSMATPHAAGAAALVKQFHADWTPAMLKGALMGSAKDLGLDLWTQGKGRLDVLKAVRTQILASPQTLSFGLDDFATTHWRRSDTVTVYNASDTAVSFIVERSTGLPAGISIALNASMIDVPAHGTAQLLVSLDVDNVIVSVPEGDMNDVAGTITLISPADTLQIPWAMVIQPYIELQVAAPENSTPDAAIFIPRSGGRPRVTYGFVTTGEGTWHARTLLPRGGYDVIVRTLGWSKFGLTWFVRDSVTVDPVASLSLSHGDALYRVGSTMKDENGEVLDSSLLLTCTTQLSSKRAGVGIFMSIVGVMEPMWDMDRVSSLSSNYVFDHYYSTDFEKPRAYTYAGQASPILTDQVIDIKPGDLMRRDIEYRLSPAVQSLKPMRVLPFWNGEWSTYSAFTTTPSLARPLHQAWYAQEHPPGRFPWFGKFVNHAVWYDGSKDSLFDPRASSAILLTPNQIPGSDGVLRSSFFMTDAPVQESRGRKIIYGLGPRQFFGRLEKSNSTHVRVESNSTGSTAIPWFSPPGTNLPLFLNQAMDAEPVNVRLGLRDSIGRPIYQSTSVDQGLVNHGYGGLNFALPEPGRYTLRLWDPSSRILSLKGAAIADLTIDTRRGDIEPPTMTRFNISGADSEYTDMLLPGEAGKVEFSTSDAASGLRSVNLLYHTDSNRTWVSLPLNKEGDLYWALLPAFSLHDRFISLRILASDVSGNSTDYRAEPALHIGPDYAYANRAPQQAQLLTPTPGGALQLYEPGPPVVFSWDDALDYDGWDTLSYTFHIRGGRLGTSADRWTQDTTVTLWLMGLMAPDELYSWWVEATDGHDVVASDTATFRTSSTVLAAPGEKSALPKEFALTQNYPNPFNPTSTIRYDLPMESRVSLLVYNVLGQEVMKLVDAEQRAGRYAVTVDGRGLASGVYIYRIQAVSSASTGGPEGNFIAVKKFVLLR